MTELVTEKRCHCPYCAEPISLVIDASAGTQTYIEDCEVCCRPIVCDVRVGADGYPAVNVSREDDVC